MTARSLLVSLIAVSSVAACSSASSEDDLGLATAAITNVPSDVACIVLNVQGNRSVEHRFDVATGASSVFSMKGLPVGPVAVTGNAYAGACSTVGASTSPTWVSDMVTTTLVASVDVPGKLSLHRNGSSTVSVDFDDGPDAGADAADSATSDAVLSTTSTAGFGSVAVGGLASRMITITNTGTTTSTGALSQAIVGADAAQFAITSGCTAALAPSASCTLSVSFGPTSRGAKSATLTVSASPGGVLSIPLSGVGLAPAQLTINPPSHDFGSQSIAAAAGAPFSFVVSNVGDVSTGTPSAPLLTGTNPSDFLVDTNTCTTAIAPGGSCTMAIRFKPSGVGTRTATLSQNPVGAPGVSATLTGTGSLF